MSDYMKEALKGAAKTKTKTNFGKPDFHIEKYRKRKVPVVIEDKLKLSKLVAETKDGVKFDENSIRANAVNGAIYYARRMIDSGSYQEVIAIGVAGDNEENVKVSVYYVFGSAFNAYKITDVKTLDFLENEQTFEEFYKEATLTDEEKHQILIDSQAKLQSYAKKLNRLMHNHNITAPQRVLYVSGMLLAMQDIIDENGEQLDDGLVPDDLKGRQITNKRDGEKIVNHISNFLKARGIEEEKGS